MYCFFLEPLPPDREAFSVVLTSSRRFLKCFLAFGLYKGMRNGLFVELASFVSLLLGIYIAIKFSDLATKVLSEFLHWNSKTIQVMAFLLSFILVIIGVSLIAKFLTKIASLAYLGWINKLGGGGFRLLKTVLIVSVFLNVFDKMNFNNTFAKKETLDKSLFYRPIQKTAGFVFPSIEKWYDEIKKK
jgi:membrane protein required for colicin V production